MTLQAISIAITYINQRFAVKNSELILWLIWRIDSETCRYNPASQKIGSRLQDMTSQIQYFDNSHTFFYGRYDDSYTIFYGMA